MSQVSHSPRLSPALVARSAALLAVCGWLALATQAGPASAQARQALTPAQHRVATSAGAAAPLNASDFSASAPEGFGDRQNGWAWAMDWWKGHLYVGTNRAFHCVEVQAQAITLGATYPPTDTDTTCTQNYADLPLQAELWRWTPGADTSAPGTWERVYQSPNDIPNPDPTLTTTHYLPEDIAYRGLATWTPDPTQPDNQYLFASGVSAKPLVGKAVAGTSLQPRLLYTQDGLNWTAIRPTASGNPVDGNCFRGAVSITNPVTGKPRFFIVTCSLQGSGQLLATDTPLDPNSYTIISGSLAVFEIVSYNNALYVGTRDGQNGYSVLKYDPSQPLTAGVTWNYTTVVPPGAGLTNNFNTDVISMKVYKGWLFIGGNGVLSNVPAEMLRIDPWDNWDVVHGPLRATPPGAVVSPLTGSDGTKYALTGLDGGFGEYFNQHMWRMTVFDDPTVGDGQLYVGTFDSSTPWKNNATLRTPLRSNMGFGLYRTGDGWYFTNVTDTGFDEMFNFGVRNMASTPYGLFVGSANYYYGTNIYRSQPSTPVLAPPRNVEINTLCGGSPVLSWSPAPGAVRYEVSRSRLGNIPLPGSATAPPVTAYYPITPTVVATTTTLGFRDPTAVTGQRYLYTVVADDGNGNLSSPSNRAEWPSLGATITADAAANPAYPQLGLLQAVQAWNQQGRFISAYSSTVQTITETSQLLQSGTAQDRTAALNKLDTLRNDVQAGGILEPLAASDLVTLIGKLSREQLSLGALGAACPAPTPPPSATPTPSSTPTVPATPTPNLTDTTATPTSSGPTVTAVPTATSVSVNSSRCTAVISSTTSAVAEGPAPGFQDTIIISGHGFALNELVHLYYNAAIPFGGPQQGSNAQPVQVDPTGVFTSTTLHVNQLAAPNHNYAIVAEGDSGSCAPPFTALVAGTQLIPVEPHITQFQYGSAPASSMPDSVTIAPLSQTIVISSSRIMSDAVGLAASIDTAASNNYSGVPDFLKAFFPIAQQKPVSIPMVAISGGGPTWGLFSLTVPGTLDFNVHSIVMTGTNPVTVTNVNSVGNTYMLNAGQVQHDASGLRYFQTVPAALTLDTTSGPAPGSVTVRGTGFAGTAPLSVTLTSAGTTLTPTDSLALSSAPDGSFTYALTLPALAPGPLTITVSDPSTTYATAPYTVLTDNGPTATPTLTISATETPTPGVTDTPTLTPTPGTITPVSTDTPTLTPTQTATPTLSPTQSATNTPTLSPTPAATSTALPFAWTAATSGTANDLFGVSCTTNNACLAVGAAGTVLRTTDAGATWATIPTTATTTQLNSVTCAPGGPCFATGKGGVLLASADGGAHWNGEAPGTAKDLYGISCPSATHCYITTGYGQIVVTTNGGATWTVQTNNPFYTLSPILSIACPTDLTCYAVGGGKRSIYTTDGGVNWNAQVDWTNPDYDFVALFGVSCPTTTMCVAVGSNQSPSQLTPTQGIIRRTTDGGLHWTYGAAETHISATIQLNGVSCVDALTCYAVGNSGVIEVATDGGVTWNQQTSGTTANLNGVSCPSATRCYAVGSGGTILIYAQPATPTATPAPVQTASLSLQPGWNLIALPLNPTTPLQAQTVLTDVIGTPGTGVAELAQWTGNGWNVALHQGATLVGDFTMQVGQGYFLYTDHPGAYTATGAPVTSAPRLTLTPGWNLIGMPTVAPGSQAHGLLNSLNAAGLAPIEAASWLSTLWQVAQWPTPDPTSDFTLSPTAGYFVYVQNGGPWTDQVSAAAGRQLAGLHRIKGLRPAFTPRLPALPATPRAAHRPAATAVAPWWPRNHYPRPM